MPRKTYKRYSKKGGFINVNESFSNLEQKFSDFGNKISQGTSDLWRKTKEVIGMDGSNTSSSYAPTTSYLSSRYGGKRTRRVKRGGSSTNTAANMANKPIQTQASNITNKPIQTLTSKVGGRRRSRRSSRRRSRR
jgi:hypothetical protein